MPRDRLTAYAAAAGHPAGTWAFEALRIARGEPRLGLDTDHRTIPNEVGWIGPAVHLDKGCYRGQETVARVHTLGRPPRRLTLLHLDGTENRLPRQGTDLLHDGRTVGMVGSSARHHELGPIALALVKRNVPLDATLDADGLPAAQEVVVDPEVGLARPTEPALGRGPNSAVDPGVPLWHDILARRSGAHDRGRRTRHLAGRAGRVPRPPLLLPSEPELLRLADRDRFLSPNGDHVSDRARFELRLDERAYVSVQVRDREWQVASRVRLGVLPAGRHVWHWDGRSSSGKVLPDGRYALVLRAWGGERTGRVTTFAEVLTVPDAGKLVLSRPVVYPAATAVDDSLDVVYVRAGYQEEIRQYWMYYGMPVQLRSRLVISGSDGERVLDARWRGYRPAFSWSARSDSGQPLPARHLSPAADGARRGGQRAHDQACGRGLLRPVDRAGQDHHDPRRQCRARAGPHLRSGLQRVR